MILNLGKVIFLVFGKEAKCIDININLSTTPVRGLTTFICVVCCYLCYQWLKKYHAAIKVDEAGEEEINHLWIIISQGSAYIANNGARKVRIILI